MQAAFVSHSSSRTQPGGLGVSMGTQLLSVSGIQPSLHEQIMVLKGTVSTTEQIAVEAHGFSSKQGFLQDFSRQARPEGQSESIVHSGSLSTGKGSFCAEQDTSGLPTSPFGQAQEATWFTVVQMAVGAHTLSNRQGSMQWFCMQALFVAQSGLILHSTVKHCSRGFPIKPGGHLH